MHHVGAPAFVTLVQFIVSAAFVLGGWATGAIALDEAGEALPVDDVAGEALALDDDALRLDAEAAELLDSHTGSSARGAASSEAQAYSELLPRLSASEVQPTSAELRTLELLGLEPSLLEELRGAATPGASTVPDASEVAELLGHAAGADQVPPAALSSDGPSGAPTAAEKPARSSSLSSNALADEALGDLRLSGLETGLRERLKAHAREGRDSGLAADSARPSSASALGLAGEALRFSSDASDHAAVLTQLLSEQEAAPADVQSYLEHVGCGAAADGEAGRPSASCPACAEIEAGYAEHDEWIASLKASAEEVLATHQRTREALDGLLPPSAARSSSGSDTG